MDWYMATNILEDFILTFPEDGSSKFLCNVSNYLPINAAYIAEVLNLPSVHMNFQHNTVLTVMLLDLGLKECIAFRTTKGMTRRSESFG